MHYMNNTRNVYAIASVFMLFCFAFLGVSAQTIDMIFVRNTRLKKLFSQFQSSTVK